MKNLDLSKIIISIFCYSISILISLIIFLLGKHLKPGDEMGYTFLCFYIIMPLTAIITSFIISKKRGYLFWLYPISFGFLGLIISYKIFGTFDFIGLFFAFISALIGLTFGLKKQPSKTKRSYPNDIRYR